MDERKAAMVTQEETEKSKGCKGRRFRNPLQIGKRGKSNIKEKKRPDPI